MAPRAFRLSPLLPPLRCGVSPSGEKGRNVMWRLRKTSVHTCGDASFECYDVMIKMMQNFDYIFGEDTAQTQNFFDDLESMGAAVGN